MQSNAETNRRGNSTFLTIDDFSSYANVGRTFIYQMIARNELATVKIGRKRLIPREAAEAWRNRLVDMQTVNAIFPGE